MKKDAITLIKQRGNCRQPINISCAHCILDHTPEMCLYNAAYEIRYEKAVELFIEEFGKEELAEILL